MGRWKPVVWTTAVLMCAVAVFYQFAPRGVLESMGPLALWGVALLLYVAGILGLFLAMRDGQGAARGALRALLIFSMVLCGSGALVHSDGAFYASSQGRVKEAYALTQTYGGYFSDVAGAFERQGLSSASDRPPSGAESTAVAFVQGVCGQQGAYEGKKLLITFPYRTLRPLSAAAWFVLDDDYDTALSPWDQPGTALYSISTVPLLSASAIAAPDLSLEQVLAQIERFSQQKIVDTCPFDDGSVTITRTDDGKAGSLYVTTFPDGSVKYDYHDAVHDRMYTVEAYGELSQPSKQRSLLKSEEMTVCHLSADPRLQTEIVIISDREEALIAEALAAVEAAGGDESMLRRELDARGLTDISFTWDGTYFFEKAG